MRTCNGESHKVFRGWLRDMEIVGNAVKHEPERMKALRPICDFCSTAGHIIAKCPMRLSNGPNHLN